METDDQLVAAARGGEQEAFRRLFDRHHAALYRLCRSFGGLGHDQALDVAQESFIRAFRRLDFLQPGAGFFGFLATIARRRCLSELRRATRQRQVATQLIREPERTAPVADPPWDDEVYRHAALHGCVVETLAGLPDGEARQAACLFYLDGLSTVEVASRLGVRKSTVTTWLDRCRARIRQRLLHRLLEAREYVR